MINSTVLVKVMQKCFLFGYKLENSVTRSTENLFMYRPWPRKRVGEHSFEMLDEYFYKKEENLLLVLY